MFDGLKAIGIVSWMNANQSSIRGIGGWQATHLKVSKSSKMFDVLVVMRTQYSLSMIDW